MLCRAEVVDELREGISTTREWPCIDAAPHCAEPKNIGWLLFRPWPDALPDQIGDGKEVRSNTLYPLAAFDKRILQDEIHKPR